MAISNETLDALMKDYQKPEDLLGNNGLLKQLTKRLLEKAMEGEVTHHLGYEKHTRGARDNGNARNGSYKKTLKGDQGEIEIQVPRDRNGDFQPQIIKKGQTRFDGFDDKIIALYGRGMTTRDISGFLQETYGVEVSASMISAVTDEIKADVLAWRNRSLEKLYPVVFFDAMWIKCRKKGKIGNVPLYFAQAIDTTGHREVLGMWIMEQEGASFWLQVLTELRNRGAEDILIACVDGLAGFPDAIRATFPRTQVQLCIVHATRASLKYVTYKDRKRVAEDLRSIYTAPTMAQGRAQLEKFNEAWGKRYPIIYKRWAQNWDELSTFYDYPPEIRRLIYTTNSIESFNRCIRKATKCRSVFPHEDAVFKLVYLAIMKLTEQWQSRCVTGWPLVANQLTILFPERFQCP